MTEAFKNGDRSDSAAVETGDMLALKYDDRGLIPAIATCADTGEVLMQAYMNADAVAKTVETGEAHYYSRSRNSLWHKGATSGEIQTVVDFRVDCDQDSLWLIVRQAGGGACHVGYRSCFYRSLPIGVAVHQDSPLVLTTTGSKKA